MKLNSGLQLTRLLGHWLLSAHHLKLDAPPGAFAESLDQPGLSLLELATCSLLKESCFLSMQTKYLRLNCSLVPFRSENTPYDLLDCSPSYPSRWGVFLC